MRYSAVLDLKSAYDSVPGELMSRIKVKLPTQLAAMALTLQPLTVTTKGDDTGTVETIPKGVTPGFNASPPLYNVQMDTILEAAPSLHKGRPQGTYSSSLFPCTPTMQRINRAQLPLCNFS